MLNDAYTSSCSFLYNQPLDTSRGSGTGRNQVGPARNRKLGRPSTSDSNLQPLKSLYKEPQLGYRNHAQPANHRRILFPCHLQFHPSSLIPATPRLQATTSLLRQHCFSWTSTVLSWVLLPLHLPLWKRQRA